MTNVEINNFNEDTSNIDPENYIISNLKSDFSSFATENDRATETKKPASSFDTIAQLVSNEKNLIVKIFS